MLWLTLVLFLLIVFGLTFGVRGLSRFAGGAVGKSTLRVHRIAEMIYTTGRIPRSWVAQELETSHPSAEERARGEANRHIEKLIAHFGRSPAFADEASRRELVGSLATMRDRLQNEAIEDLVGPDPQLRRIVVFFDCGDTLADEGTEVKGADGATLRAKLIPGAAGTVRRLKRRGYTLALVADGPRATFENILKRRGLWRLFDAYAISGDVGVTKPDARM
ncbi:MAG: HAD hydrolase-like protein, partial [Spirochaetales bacterium]|nr:HAD hydrolase-like protein [Spirochaetales bacterium]